MEPILERERTARRRLVVGIGVLVMAVIGFALWKAEVRSTLVFVALPFFSGALYLVARVWASDWVPDLRVLARRIEEENPELNSLLITAVEQEGGGEIGYLQERVVIEAVQEALARDWSGSVSKTQARFSRVLEISGAVALLVVWALFFPKFGPDGGLTGAGAREAEEAVEEELVEPGEVSVEPGDVEVERGSRLVVRARFAEDEFPGEASLVVAKHDGTEERVAMNMALGDPVFTAVLDSVEEDMDYRVEFGELASDEFEIDTYVLPTLERSDVVVVQPDWVGGGEKSRKDTLRASVSEGGEVTFTFHLNKVVEEALLVPVAEKGKKQAEGEAIVLGGGAIVEAPMVPEESGKWRLTLVDEDGRENRDKPLVSVVVKRNLPPKIELAFPKGDVDATPVQEVPLEASFWDDYGVVSAGMKYRFKGEESDVVFETVAFEADKKNAASTLLELERLGAKPNDLVTYHFYAEDETTKGEKRRVESDMFFVEVRHFEEIFREGAAGESGQQQQQQEQQQGEQGGVAGQLLEAQKDVINATWKVRREGEVMAGEIPVLKGGQEEVLVLAEEAGADVQDELLLQALESAKASMGEAVEALAGEDLKVALEQEQTAYGHLLAMRAREF
ncbi:MAG: hypothetical protein P8J87_07890 [Verrucomicrobiales bacterium]|nr:hypothetical protein [Verrucomicrobiales bacterium]